MDETPQPQEDEPVSISEEDSAEDSQTEVPSSADSSEASQTPEVQPQDSEVIEIETEPVGLGITVQRYSVDLTIRIDNPSALDHNFQRESLWIQNSEVLEQVFKNNRIFDSQFPVESTKPVYWENAIVDFHDNSEQQQQQNNNSTFSLTFLVSNQDDLQDIDCTHWATL